MILRKFSNIQFGKAKIITDGPGDRLCDFWRNNISEYRQRDGRCAMTAANVRSERLFRTQFISCRLLVAMH